MMTDWAIPQQAKLKYTQLFNLHDRSRSGFLSGLQCRDILLQSGLPRNILAEIWNLSDIDGDGQLTREEFILAMHLTNHVRSGQTLPTELPPDLVPPSYRRARSISTTSVHSATSASSSVGAASGSGGLAGSSNTVADDQTSQKSSDNANNNAAASSFAAGSVLNSNSFEDKRRENFEKGRAELERRRLKIIEQQTGILREQLTSSKKQVTDAKAKIDSMRSDRDAKMGFITSLEAQLKTLQDKKAYLNREEQSLIAIAKDLNLVNSAQAELDQLATQAKQQSINQMKEKLGDFLLEKEAKIKELAEVTGRLEELKKELKVLTERVIKTFETYKEKVADAKVMRKQFIDENKSQTADLDSVWDSAPSFSRLPNQSTGITSGLAKLESTDNSAFSTTNEDPWATSNNNNDATTAFSMLSSKGETQDFLSKNNPITPISTAELFSGSEFDQKTSSGLEQVAQGKRYRALYAFDARNPDELTINPGDIIVGSEVVCEPGWVSGELNGRVGLFPEAYVEPILDPVTGETFKSLPQTTEPPSVEPMQQRNFVAASKESSTRYKVVYAFDARNPDELTINPGDTIIGLEGVHEPGWLMGELNGQKGLFPEAYVERMVESVQAQPEVGTLQRMSSVGSLRSKKSRSKRAEVATVIANYRALGQEQLNLEKGQLVLIRRKMDSGWWEGEIQLKDDEFKFDKSRSELDNLISELIVSETDFVTDLRLCQSAYISPLSKLFDVSNIFVKWDELIRVHEGPLSKLLAGLNLDSITIKDYAFVFETFQSMLSSLDQLYIEFCSRQSESARMFDAKLVSDIRFKQQVNDCQRSLVKYVEQQVLIDGDGATNQIVRHGPHSLDSVRTRAMRNASLPLTSFILKPMQRITKYSLLFVRMIKTITKNGPREFEAEVLKLKMLAQSLCNQVNEACRLKEDNEDNIRKLRWAQTHIKQTLSQHNDHSQTNRYSIPTIDSKLSLELASDQLANNNEIILFDSNTNCMGKRKFIKSGCLIKAKTGKELALFLFNDLILLTQIKSVSPLKVEDIFLSTKAQQTYYKLYRAPILMEDIVVQDASTNRLALDQSQSQHQNLRSSWSEQQLLAVSFSDKSNGNSYYLLAINPQEKTLWLRELSQKSEEAREARAKYQAQQLVRPMLRKPSIQQCFGRLFVTVLEIANLQSNLLSLQAQQSKDQQQHTLNSLGALKRSSTPDHSLVAKICIQLQMKRLRPASRPTSSSQLLLEDEKKELRPMTDIFKTSVVPISNNDYSGLTKSSPTNLMDGIVREDSVILFNEESTQFMMENKAAADGADILDIALQDDSKFRETRLIARRRINIDQLIGSTRDQARDIYGVPTEQLVSFGGDHSNQSTTKLQPNRPVELVFKLKNANLQTNREINSRSSYRLSPDRGSSERSSAHERPSMDSGSISIKMRLHLQLFQSENNCLN